MTIKEVILHELRCALLFMLHNNNSNLEEVRESLLAARDWIEACNVTFKVDNDETN